MAEAKRYEHAARDYQVEILEKTLEQNVIICLGTGSGKTFISVMLIKELLYETYSCFEAGGKRSVFLAPTVSLAKQQVNYLKKFLDAEIGVYVGLDVDLWTKAVWTVEFSAHNVLVMTPQVFLNILNFNYVQLSSVNLLVLDECHAASGKAPYVQIMQNHYKDLEEGKRPKILGLTASVLNRKVKPTSVQKEVRELCSRLNSKIVTSVDAISYGTKPTEIIVSYNEIPPVQIQVHVSPCDASVFCAPNGENSLVAQIERLLREVGPFGALKSIEHRIHITKNLLENSLAESHVIGTYKTILVSLERVEASLKAWSTNVRCGFQKNQYPVVIPPDLRNILVDPLQYSFPPKVHRLLEMFRSFERSNITLCCVVFAQERYTVFSLWCVLSMLSRRCPNRYGYIRPGFIMGQGIMSQFSNTQSKIMNFVDERETTDSDQHVLNDFREKRLNVLVATAVIEEGIDIPYCNLVVRFNEPINLRSYVQSRGRARSRPSVYAVMCPRNTVHKMSVALQQLKESELNVLVLCLQDNMDIDSADMEKALRDDPDLPTLFAFPNKPRDSAIITAQSARTILQWYCDLLSDDRFKVLKPKFQYTTIKSDAYGHKIRCNIELPRESKLFGQQIYGKFLENKIKAKISAALEACKRLYDVGELTENLIPKRRPPANTYEWTDEEVSDEIKALFKNNTITQDSSITCGRAQASQLKTCPIPRLPACAKVFAFRITLHEPFVDENYHGRIFNVGNEPLCFGILTFNTEDVGTIPDFPLFTKAGVETVRVEQIHDVFITEVQWSICSLFHRYMVTRVLRIAGVECDPFAAPAIVPISGNKLNYTLMNMLRNSTDFTLSIDSVVTVTSELNERETKRSYFVGELFQEDGMLTVSLLGMPRNIDYVACHHRVKTMYKEETPDAIKRRYAKHRNDICVELLTASQWSKGLSVASCLYRLNRLLVAENIRMNIVHAGIGKAIQEASSMRYERLSNDSRSFRSKDNIRLDGITFILDEPIDSSGPSAIDIYTALSPRSANDIVDSERYEVIGDSYLKLVVTLDLFGRFDSKDEGYLTQQRCRLVSNMHLVTLAVPHKIQDAVESLQFCARANFLPPGCKTADGHQDMIVQKYKSKICADSVEALIGVYLEKSGANGALNFLNYLGLKLDCRTSGSFVSRFNLSSWTEPEAELVSRYLPRFKRQLYEVQTILDYQFSKPLLLLEAITHQSYTRNCLTRSYERLEFLGDAVVDYLVSRYLYYNCPQLSPGELSNSRAALVCNTTLARAVTNHQLHKHLLHQSPVLLRLTECYLAALEKGVLDEVLICEDDSDDVSAVDVPKPLGDLFESLIGAVFLDTAMNFERTWIVFRRLIGDDVIRNYLTDIPRHPVTMLMEMYPNMVTYGKIEILENKRVRLEMSVMNERFTVTARNKKVARITLAKKALRHFDQVKQCGKDFLGAMERIAKELQL
ncbi:endoribonuclease Dicer-like isoform X3 [Varroa destructor]|nr:endoribonuclease Dicer-like isoform X3 [Varroa destructor]XP_022665040.1 endoribonuclease Dicer-like isoform X3 [Varroa destructor]XP_022665041.1 endoribonuclease Dicer-like isoform X3 [Varroa destructor]XP_022665042.1 endoribonuclease Dicer-like isoform X3 [Varroa destructor]XP_022665043.1 endoribonuclease Dicer-like isoform X3 [Varroa destructor]